MSTTISISGIYKNNKRETVGIHKSTMNLLTIADREELIKKVVTSLMPKEEKFKYYEVKYQVFYNNSKARPVIKTEQFKGHIGNMSYHKLFFLVNRDINKGISDEMVV